MKVSPVFVMFLTKLHTKKFLHWNFKLVNIEFYHFLSWVLYLKKSLLLNILIHYFYVRTCNIVYVFNFPRFYSIFCVDFSQLFDPFHTYLKHGTVMGSNICEWKQKYLWMDHFPSYLFVYRQANLCSGLRVIFVLNY